MISQILALVGLLMLFGSLGFSAIHGVQIAVIGSGFLLTSIQMELTAIHKSYKKQNPKKTQEN